MRGAIESHGGTVEKYIGDAVMAVFGIPQLHEDDALRAARAAVDMREGLASLTENSSAIGASRSTEARGRPSAGIGPSWLLGAARPFLTLRV
jgi:class 3 adenylate cyclase